MKPKTRGDCLDQGLARKTPCPYLTCKHHLLLDSTYITSKLKKWERYIKYKNNWVWLDVPITDEEIVNILISTKPQYTCVLEMASKGTITLQEISNILGVTRERARQIAHNKGASTGAIEKIKRSRKTRQLIEEFR